MDDFKQALAVVEPSAIRELFTEIPDVKWSDVGGLNDIKQLLDETIQWPLRHQDLFKKAGISPPKGILLCGPPGVGKTMLAKALATESGINFISVKGPALMSKWVGETERAVRDMMSDNHLGRCRQPPWPVGLDGRRACPSGGQPHRPD